MAGPRCEPADALMERGEQTISLATWRAAAVAAAVVMVVVTCSSDQFFIRKHSPPDGLVCELIKIRAWSNQRVEVSRPANEGSNAGLN